jgi:hypothetical protein
MKVIAGENSLAGDRRKKDVETIRTPPYPSHRALDPREDRVPTLR